MEKCPLQQYHQRESHGVFLHGPSIFEFKNFKKQF